MGGTFLRWVALFGSRQFGDPVDFDSDHPQFPKPTDVKPGRNAKPAKKTEAQVFCM
jgi:hypothetical protein